MYSITVRTFHGVTLRTHYFESRLNAIKTAFNEAEGSGLYVSIKYTPAAR